MPHSDTAPLYLTRLRVEPQWIDYNGHMNVAFYVLAFDRGIDVLYDRIGLGADYLASHHCSSFTLELHVSYLREVGLDDPLDLYARVLDYDAKRLHLFLEMVHADQGYLAATLEQIGIHIDMQTRAPAPFSPHITESIRALYESHRSCPEPPQRGRVIGIRRQKNGPS